MTGCREAEAEAAATLCIVFLPLCVGFDDRKVDFGHKMEEWIGRRTDGPTSNPVALSNKWPAAVRCLRARGGLPLYQTLSLSDFDSEIKTRLGALFHLLQAAPINDVRKIRRDFRPPNSLCLHIKHCLSPKCGTFFVPFPLSADVLYGSPLTLLTESYDCLSAE